MSGPVEWCAGWIETMRIAPPFSKRRRELLAALNDPFDEADYVEVQRPTDDGELWSDADTEFMCVEANRARLARRTDLIQRLIEGYRGADLSYLRDDTVEESPDA